MIAQGLINLGFVPLVDFICQDDGDGPYLREWLSAQPQPSQEEIEAAAATPVPVVRRYSKRKLYGALSDAQFATFKQYQATQPERMQAVFESAVELSSADPDWSQFVGLMNAAYGETEAARLLNEARL